MARHHFLGTLCVVAVSLGIGLGTPSHAFAAMIGYGDGFVWNAGQDWDGGGPVGSTAGNPDDDQSGNPTWQYERVSGDGLGGADPWYAKNGTVMPWGDVLPQYPGWQGTVPPSHPAGWAVTVFTGPGSNNSSSGNHVAYDATHWSEIPLLRWTNPVGMVGMEVNILGQLGLSWGLLDSAFAVDVVIAHVDAGTGSVTPLYSNPVVKPVGLGSAKLMYLNIDLPDVMIDPDDQIVITHRYRGFADRDWAEMTNGDLDIVISILPEPGTLMLLLVASSAVFLRRRRRG